MAVTYKKLFKLLIDRDLKKQDLAEKAQISAATISKMAAGDNVTMEVVEKICRALDCSFDDIVEIVPVSSSEKRTDVK
jgi:DNA-binding Xre family transcriptional regulator